MSDNPKHLGKVYNIVQQEPVPADQVFARMEERGYITGRVDLKEWKSRMESMADQGDDVDLKVLARSLDSVEGYLADTSVYDVRRFTAALSQIDLASPKVDVDYVTMFLKVVAQKPCSLPQHGLTLHVLRQGCHSAVL